MTDDSDAYLLRPAEVTELLGVSRSWLYDAAKAGRIPCLRLGGPDGPVRFRANELNEWIDRSRLGADEPAVEVSSARDPNAVSRRRRRRHGSMRPPPVEQLRLIPDVDR